MVGVDSRAEECHGTGGAEAAGGNVGWEETKGARAQGDNGSPQNIGDILGSDLGPGGAVEIGT